jgi:hypothetical protein
VLWVWKIPDRETEEHLSSLGQGRRRSCEQTCLGSATTSLCNWCVVMIDSIMDNDLISWIIVGLLRGGVNQ